MKIIICDISDSLTGSFLFQLILIYIFQLKIFMCVNILVWFNHNLRPEALVNVIKMLAEIVRHVIRYAFVNYIACLEGEIVRFKSFHVVTICLTPSVFLTKRSTYFNILCFWGFSPIQNSKSLATHLRKH